jgi:hypothetical protein
MSSTQTVFLLVTAVVGASYLLKRFTKRRENYSPTELQKATVAMLPAEIGKIRTQWIESFFRPGDYVLVTDYEFGEHCYVFVKDPLGSKRITKILIDGVIANPDELKHGGVFQFLEVPTTEGKSNLRLVRDTSFCPSNRVSIYFADEANSQPTN